mgnify:CR=1 FL=1
MLSEFYNWSGQNKALFILLNHYTNQGILPKILYYISNIFFIANFAAAYLLILIYLILKTARSSDRGKFFWSWYYEMIKIGICYSLFGLTFAALKFGANLARPFCSLDTGDFITIANTELERCLSSFPSAHTGLSILVTYCLWPHLNKYYRCLCVLVMCLVSLSRITLAMHYPADIIYSSIVTILVICTSVIVFRLLKNNLISSIGRMIVTKIFP